MMESTCLTAGVSMEWHHRLYRERKLKGMYNFTCVHVGKACRGRGNERQGKGGWAGDDGGGYAT